MDWFTLIILAAIGAVVFGLVIAGMAIGVIFSNRRIKGSCGGMASMKDGGSPCMVCGGSPDDCDDLEPGDKHPADCEKSEDCSSQADGCGHCERAAGTLEETRSR